MMRLKLGCTKDLCSHLFLQFWCILSLSWHEVVWLNHLLYAHDLFLMSETIAKHSNKFRKWMESF